MTTKATKKTARKPQAETRDSLRASLLGNAPKPLRKELMLFGKTIELQQPTLGAILDSQAVEDMKMRAVDMIIQFAYVPGTNERIFEPADYDTIVDWPFGEELVDVQMAIAELTGVDIEDAEEVLQQDPLEEQS